MRVVKAQVELGLHPHKQWRAVQRVWKDNEEIGTIIKAGQWRDDKAGYEAAHTEAEKWNSLPEETDDV